MEKKYIQDKDGNKILPITHMSAVRDDNGNPLDSVLGAFMDGVNSTIDERMDEQEAMIELLEGHDVTVVSELPVSPSSGDEDKIFRVAGSDSYTDYMWQNNEWRAIATYDFPGIDDEPTAGSSNLVKSEGIKTSIDKKTQKIDVFLPATVLDINPSICVNTGYIATDKTIQSNSNYGYSEPINVLAGQRLYIHGAGTGIPYFAYCTSDGTITGVSGVSSGMESVFTTAFNQDAYIRVQGRVIPYNGLYVLGEIYSTGSTIGEIDENISKIDSTILYNVKKSVATRGAIYRKRASGGVSVTLNTLFVYDTDKNATTTINSTTTYTLNNIARYLVLTKDNAIETRVNSTAVLSTDYILLYYDDNVAENDIKGGALYTDYISSLSSFLNTSILKSTGYINSNGQVESSSNNGYSDPLSIDKGDTIVLSGVGTRIPYYIVCSSDGTFISASDESSAIDSVKVETFSQNTYIRVQGRTVRFADGILFNGTIFKQNNPLQEYFSKIEKSISGVENAALYNIKKYVSARGAVYTKSTNNVSITLNTLFVYDINKTSADEITDTNTYVLSGSGARYLVLTKDNTLSTRLNSSYVLSTDFILLFYDADELSQDIKGGALFADYLLYTLTQVPVSNTGKVVPSNLGQINCIRKAYQMATFKWTPKIANVIPYNSGTFPASQRSGMIYSSAKEYNTFVFEDISLETFMTAVNNTRSVLYTENISAANSRSSIGKTYHGINCAAYYGSVCSGLLIYAYGLPINITTFEFRYWDKMEVIQDQTAYGLEIGDAIWQNGHIQLVTGITKDEYGLITDIEVVENAAATTVIKHFTVTTLQSYITNNNCVILRYKDLYANRDYTPLTDFVAVMGETQGSYTYNDDICPNYGNKSNYVEGDNVVLNIRTDYVDEGFTTLEVYKDDVLLISRAIVGENENLSDLTYGNYKARITGSRNSEYTEFKVVNVAVTQNAASFNFSSYNAIPVYYEFCDITGERDHDAGRNGLTTKQFTSAEISSGIATPSGNVVPSTSFKYLKVHFKTDYGRIVRIIEWQLT